MTRVRIGCSGWNYTDWRGRLYPRGVPQRRWLELYAEHFDTVEVNATFYRLPARDMVRGWCAHTPEGFCFAVKASRYLTHIRRLTEVEDGMRRLAERLEPLASGGRLGPILWQLPESFPRDDGRLAGLLAATEHWPVRHTIEFRHPSWFAAPVLRALREHDVALTIGDHPDRPFQSLEATAGWRYVRLHYGAAGGDGRYSEDELATWARRIAQWRRRADVHVYLNNDWCGYAPENARSLARRLAVGPPGRP
ncbi:MAG TPA: DUF72 domain-containing protein [Solirubrobacteraceae bacterium]|nr:DUF72 domain-containing protein [Solirubrobacteraceae bacterium]